jgi:hypothetical protein
MLLIYIYLRYICHPERSEGSAVAFRVSVQPKKTFTQMPFFFILLVWAFCVLIGTALLFFRNLRSIGSYVIAVPTGATLVSLALSTSVLYFVPRFTHGSHPQWLGIALIAGYLIALALGAPLGALGAFLLLLKLPARKRV